MLARVVSVASLCSVAACAASTPGSAPASSVIGVVPEAVVWSKAPPSLPPGAELAVLEGDPRGAGLFTLRVRLPADYRVPPHTHAQPERVTVLSGSVHIGFGTSFDAATRRYSAGSYYVNPPALPHFLWTDEPTVLQITTTGPWTVELATPRP